MLPTPNLQQIAHQTQEFAKSSKDHRLGLVFQTVSMVSMTVLGVGAAVHLLREMLRHPHHHHSGDHKEAEHQHTAKPGHRHHAKEEHPQDEPDDHSMTRHVRHRSHSGYHRG